MLTQEDMIEIFSKSQAQLYKKFGAVACRLAIVGESIITNIAGEQETQNTAKEADVVVRGALGEEYILSLEKFSSRYNIDKPVHSHYQLYEPCGTCLAFEYRGEPLQFMAAWGEAMIVQPNDFLATTSEDVPEVYRIERNAFFSTYKLVQ